MTYNINVASGFPVDHIPYVFYSNCDPIQHRTHDTVNFWLRDPDLTSQGRSRSKVMTDFEAMYIGSH